MRYLLVLSLLTLGCTSATGPSPDLKRNLLSDPVVCEYGHKCRPFPPPVPCDTLAPCIP